MTNSEDWSASKWLPPNVPDGCHFKEAWDIYHQKQFREHSFKNWNSFGVLKTPLPYNASVNSASWVFSDLFKQKMASDAHLPQFDSRQYACVLKKLDQ